MTKRFNTKKERQVILARIAALHNAGFMPAEIATAVELPESLVHNIVYKYSSAFEKIKTNQA